MGVSGRGVPSVWQGGTPHLLVGKPSLRGEPSFLERIKVETVG
jgi:hypothetical protein